RQLGARTRPRRARCRSDSRCDARGHDCRMRVRRSHDFSRQLWRESWQVSLSPAQDHGRRVVSATVTLSLRAALDGSLEVEGVTGDRFATMSEREIADLPVLM